MSPQNVKIVIGVCLVIVSLVGVPWAESTANQTALEPLDAPPARKSCGDIQIPGPVLYPPIKVEVVQGNVPCRVAQRVMKDQFREVSMQPAHTGPWNCGGRVVGLRVCVKNRGGQEKNRGGKETIRGRNFCRDWGALRTSCLNTFGPP